MLAMLRPRHDHAINLDCHRPLGETEVDDQVSKGKTLWDFPHRAIDSHLHRPGRVTREPSDGACGRGQALRRFYVMESGVGAAAHIPPKRKEDPADVARALAMAEAVFTHGDRVSALKWLQRAAEAASEAQADTRALELAKAAADLANANRVAATEADEIGAGSTTGVGRSSGGTQPGVKRPQAPPRSGLGLGPPGRPTMRATPEESAPPRTDKPSPWTSRPENAAFSPNPPSSRPGLIGRPTPWVSPPSTDDEDGEEKTRVGVLRYRTTAEMPQERPSREKLDTDSGLQVSQAVRVVVWRAADGVHVAPKGARVGALTVEAILVAIDGSTDLGAWLTGK